MDEARRAELNARRDALLGEKRKQAFAADRASYVRMVPILSALEAAGEDYDSHDYRRLRGALNRWAHAPEMLTETYEAFPADPAARYAIILAALREKAPDGALIVVILRSEEMVLELRLSVLERHLPSLLESAHTSEIGFAVPPQDWFVEVSARGVATGTLPA